MSIAVVTIAHERHQHLARQQKSLSRGTGLPDHWVLVSMSDPALDCWRVVDGVEPCVVPLPVDPTALPLAAARNRGAQAALDLGADVLVFLDADCLAGPDLVAGYERAVRVDPTTIWSGPVTYLPEGLGERELMRPWLLDRPHAARPAPAPGSLVHGAKPDLFWSLSFAMSAGAWRRSGGFEESYVGYGAEDTDFAHQASARGLGLGWVGDSRAYHQHHPTSDPPVQHLDDLLRNGALFAERWGRWPMDGWFEAMQTLGLVVRRGEGWARAEPRETRSAGAPDLSVHRSTPQRALSGSGRGRHGRPPGGGS